MTDLSQHEKGTCTSFSLGSERTQNALESLAKENGWKPTRESEEQIAERIQKDFAGLCACAAENINCDLGTAVAVTNQEK